MKSIRCGQRWRGLAMGQVAFAMLSLSACGGGGSDPGGPSATPDSTGPAATPAAQARLSSPASGAFPWRLATPAQLSLTGPNGQPVPAGSLRCTAQDDSRVHVTPDCTRITALRIGPLDIVVQGEGHSATLTVTGTPVPQWSGAQGGTPNVSLVRSPDGRALAWGDNQFSLLGAGKPQTALPWLTAPEAVVASDGQPALDALARVSVGYSVAAALRQDGTVWSWGANNGGRALAHPAVLNTTATPVPVLDGTGQPRLQGIVQVEAGSDRMVALRDDGTALAWGIFPGNNTLLTASLPVTVSNPEGTGPLGRIVAVSSGRFHALALDADGLVYAWGQDIAYAGQLGAGDFLPKASPAAARPVRVVKQDGQPLGRIVQISAGYDFNLALDEDGRVWAWGSNAYGQLGQGQETTTGHPAAMQVKDSAGTGLLSGIRMVAAGGGHALALRNDGQVYAWGLNNHGEAGDGQGNPAGQRVLLPRLVVAEAGLAPLSGVASVAAGERHSLALLNDGRVLAWGRDYNATLGRGVVDNSLYAHVPAAVRGEGASGTLSLPTSAYPNLTNRAR